MQADGEAKMDDFIEVSIREAANFLENTESALVVCHVSPDGDAVGSALALAGASGTAVKGVLLLVTYSMGLGVPFVLSAVLIEKLNTAFAFIKKHYRVINIVCGSFLILIGVLMACGLMDRIVAIFS